MNSDLKQKIENETHNWQYAEELAEDKYGFKLNKIFAEFGNKYDLFEYSNANHCRIKAYYDEDTREYKVRVKIGCNEYCKPYFFAGELAQFESLLKGYFDEELSKFNSRCKNSLVAKDLGEWKYAQELPEELEGFKLFIKPTEAVEYTNGSYIILDYSDFATESSLSILHNIYKNDYGNEVVIRGESYISDDFGASSVEELEELLKEKLTEKLREIREMAEKIGAEQ